MYIEENESIISPNCIASKERICDRTDLNKNKSKRNKKEKDSYIKYYLIIVGR